MTSSSDEDEIECPLNGAEALAACKEFANRTSTNTGLAMMFLQQNQWNIERAIENYLQQSKKKSKRLKILSWNIDGLDEQQNTIEIRTRAIADVIKREEPDAVFLQEVVSISLEILRQNLNEYEFHSGQFAKSCPDYFVVILTRRDRFRVNKNINYPFPNSRMNRNLFNVETIYDDSIHIDLFTSHFESGADDETSDVRVQQLKLAVERILETPKNRFVFFGGDLNLREKDLKKFAAFPSEIVDLWIATGRRKECAFTWDMNVNTNLSFDSTGFRPRARFDRLYFRSADDKNVQIQPIYFELEGLEKIPSIKRFCSDHWAIQSYLDVEFI